MAATMTETEPAARIAAVKIVVAGGFGTGKTTFVGSISEVPPLTTEAHMTEVSEGVDDASKVSTKTTTTVAMDFGRITIDPTLVLYLFGTPGQDRFGFMWDDIAEGAIGAIVLVDTRRIEACFAAVDYFESRGIPIVVCVNQWADSEVHDLDEVRDALGLAPTVPMVRGDARERLDVKHVLVTLLQDLMKRARESAGAA